MGHVSGNVSGNEGGNVPVTNPRNNKGSKRVSSNFQKRSGPATSTSNATSNLPVSGNAARRVSKKVDIGNVEAGASQPTDPSEFTVCIGSQTM